ncbi:MAG: DUF378 domain-containing protein [Actinobacteria bacterium]|nr:DUF378 domain-containing protein [Actinomycetota bacterium]
MVWLFRTALALAIIGAINWLLVGLFQWDLVQALSGASALRPSTIFSRIIYTLVGLGGLYLIPYLFREKIELTR